MNEPIADTRLDALRKLAKGLPVSLESDWDGTNHYEMHAPCDDDDYWWLTLLGDGWYSTDRNPCESMDGRRVGLLMDIAAEVARLRDEGAI